MVIFRTKENDSEVIYTVGQFANLFIIENILHNSDKKREGVAAAVLWNVATWGVAQGAPAPLKALFNCVLYAGRIKVDTHIMKYSIHPLSSLVPRIDS